MFLSDMSGREPLYKKYVTFQYAQYIVMCFPTILKSLQFCLHRLIVYNHFPFQLRAFVFFSTPVPKQLVNHIKGDMSVVPRIGALREVRVISFGLYTRNLNVKNLWPSCNVQMNLEFFPVDSQV